MKRETQAALDAAEAVIRAAGLGFATEQPRGRGHWMAVAILPDGGRLRVPVPGTPSGGQGQGVFLAEKAARKVLRRHGFEVRR